MELIYIGKAKTNAALVDDSDYDLVMQYDWTLKTDPKSRAVYAVRYIRIPGVDKYKREYMHTTITGFSECDHIDGDGLNNQRSNLREVTHAQNIQAQRTQLRSKSGYRGVTFFPDSGRWKRNKPWRARIKIDGRDITIGYFETKEEAARAWNELAFEAWGEYAQLNQITEERR